MDLALRGEDARAVSERLLRLYFRTQDYPFTRHHLESFDQFLSQDLPAIIQTENPLILLEDRLGSTPHYSYKAEIYVGGLDGSRIYIGTPTVSLKDSKEVRLLFPNEARLRNLTYSSVVEADIVVRITMTSLGAAGEPITRVMMLDPNTDAAYKYLARFPLFRIPIMLHSRYCQLHGKPQAFLQEVGECQYDSGGYFVVNGAEKVLITHQEQAFNTLYISPQKLNPKVSIYASITSMNPQTRQLRRIAFGWARRSNVLEVTLPFVRKPLPIFVLFRALGIQSDEDILRLIFPDGDSAEAKLLTPLLHESILDAHPFYDTYSAVQYIKVLTKGFSEAHVLDILHNKTLIHVEDRPRARATFLADCVRRILRVKAGIDSKTDRDDTRNQRCLTSGVLVRQLFQGIYTAWLKSTRLTLAREYKRNRASYQGASFSNLFIEGTLNEMFGAGQMTETILKAFKGKWSSGTGAGVGEEKTGVIQALSRLSYTDFMSHCRRVVLDFDTGMKQPEPRRLHTSQYGYFCTNETPGGASIGITKNLSILAGISTSTDPAPVIEWLYSKGGVMTCDQVTPSILAAPMVSTVYVNGGIVGYTLRALALRDTLKVLKWTGCLPATAGVGFSARDRAVFLYLDEGRPVRPLIHLGPRGSIPVDALKKAGSWRDLVLGVLPQTAGRGLHQGGFIDPLAADAGAGLEDYVKMLAPNAGVVEYMDSYEMNEAYIANFPENIHPETSHMEIHPSTIVGLMTSMIPFANYNQSPRNQLSCSQSKQGLSVYSTAFPNRFDNQAHVLCYAQAPLVRTVYYDYLADGQMGYGHNLILAMGAFTGYNQDDGIVMNADAIERGMFRSTFYRSYEAFEENDPMTHSKTRIGNPATIPGWTALKPGLDYSKLDARGIVRVGELVDETSVLVGRYLTSQAGDIRDASVPAQVWTRGRVERVSVTTNNEGLAMVKVKVVQERIPELGDKFCLTADHEVYTEDAGWVGLAELAPGKKVKQWNRIHGGTEFVVPTELMSFEHSGALYEFTSYDKAGSMLVTAEHRMFVKNARGERELMTAQELFHKEENYSFLAENQVEWHLIGTKQFYKANPVGRGVYCLKVPSEIFLVRRAAAEGRPAGRPYWTGNSNRHGQKGTIGMLIRGHDMPRTRDGIPVDMIMNPHAIPSRMTVAQLVEAIVGKAAPALGAVGNGTMFMNEGNPMDQIGKVLVEQLGMEPMGEEYMYDGMSGRFVPTRVFVGNVYTMRLKHMPEDKWNARGEGRREQRTHQPTGGRGAQGGLRIGEMERDAIAGHGVTSFLRESMMQRSDGYQTWVCNGCGGIPIYNEADKLFFCSTCDGPARFTGDDTMESYKLMPAIKRSVISFSKVEMPYAMKVLDQEMATYLNMSMRFLTAKDLKQMRPPAWMELTGDQQRALLDAPLPTRTLPETVTPEYVKQTEQPEVRTEDLAALGAVEDDAAAIAAEVEALQREIAAATAQRVAGNVTGAAETLAGAAGAAAPPPGTMTVPGTNLVMQPATSVAAAAAAAAEFGYGPEEYGEEEAAAAAAAAPPQQAQAPQQAASVNVQTTTQPVLIVPMNVAQAPPPGAEYIPPPVPGAPATLAVDTGDAAMRNLGLPSNAPANGLRGGGGGGGGGGSRSRSGSPRRYQMPGGGGAVSVNKLGGGGGGSSDGGGSNMRVMVNKMG